MFEEYVSRSEALHYNSTLIFLYVLGGILVSVAFVFGGFLMIRAYIKRENQEQTIYLPLGLLLIVGFLRVGFEIVAVWHNYAWIISSVTMLWGTLGFWFLVTLPGAIKRRKELLQSYKKMKEQEQQLVDTLKGIKESV